MAEVHPGDAHVAQSLSFSDSVLQLLRSVQLFLEATESEGVIAQRHVDGAQVSMRSAFPARIPHVLQNGKFL